MPTQDATTYPFPKITVDLGTAPSSPSAGSLAVYADEADGHLKTKSSAGTVIDLTDAASIADIVDIATAETDTDLVLAPDGAGGVEWRAETGGGAPDAAPSIVQVYSPATISDNGTATLGSTPTNGNMLLAFVGSNQYPASTVTTTNVTWAKVGELQPQGTDFAYASVWKGTVAASAGTGVQIDFTGSNKQMVCIVETNATTLDVFVPGAATNAGAATVSGVSMTPGGLWLLFHYTRAAVAASAEPSGTWTDLTGSEFALDTSTHHGRVASYDAHATGGQAAGSWYNGTKSQSMFLVHLK